LVSEQAGVEPKPSGGNLLGALMAKLKKPQQQTPAVITEEGSIE